MYRTWRDKVYSGTLRRSPLPMAETKTTLINTLTECMMVDPRPHTYNDHSISMIEHGLYLGDGSESYVTANLINMLFLVLSVYLLDIYIIASSAACDLHLLQKEGFTHVLNMAEGYGIGCVNTNSNYYRRTNIKYKGIKAYDRPSFPLDSYFNDAIKFIEGAMLSGGKILVHCVMGISRSASAVIAYLIVAKKIRASQALRYVYQRRIVQPNDGFMEQLAKFSNMHERDTSRSRYH